MMKISRKMLRIVIINRKTVSMVKIMIFYTLLVSKYLIQWLLYNTDKAIFTILLPYNLIYFFLMKSVRFDEGRSI